MIASVLVFRGAPDCYTYDIPDSLRQAIQLGSPVKVPFGAGQTDGIVVDIAADETTIPLKPIKAIDPKRPTTRPDQINLMNWFRAYYITTPYKAFQTVIGKQTIRKLPETVDTPVSTSPIRYTLDQQHAIDTIMGHSGYQEFLLHGVTGSGKTEIYLRLVSDQLCNGKQAIVLVPEIALTPQVSQIFTNRLGSRVAILHSGLSVKQRSEMWNTIYSGQCDVVIGARSAVFAPLERLGLLIVDECHDGSYKQDQHPRYDALQVAQYRARTHDCALVLGSATPTLEQMSPSRRPSITRLRLPNRANGASMPAFHVLDTRDKTEFPDDSLIGKRLLDAAKIAISKQEKVMILVNRRGYAPAVICQKCQESVLCPTCELPYTYHSDRSLRCHRCFTQVRLPYHCPNCKKGRLGIAGTAIQKIEFELRRLIPQASILRLDRDNATSGKDIHGILDLFRQTGDLLIGTQMIAKGHDIPQVTVVGIIGIDSALSLPDFRAAERAFQLITQVAGRAGRGTLPGDVYIQTAKPFHYAIECATQYDTDRFVETETRFRSVLRYPPFTTLTNIIFSAKRADLATDSAADLYRLLTDPHLKLGDTQVMPPQPAPVEMVKGYTRYHILIKGDIETQSDLKQSLKQWRNPNRSVRVIIDFDPHSIL